MRTGPEADPDATVHLFGGPTLRVRGEVVALSPLQTCLAAVVFGGEGPRRGGPGAPTPGSRSEVSRRKLVRLLWRKDSPETRHRLSQLLYSFTKKRGGATLFRAGPDSVGPGQPTGARDLEHFHELLETGDLIPAVQLLDRGYLSGVSTVPGRRFEEWWERERARVRTALRQAAASRWTTLTASESWSLAADAAVVMLRLDPDDESALRNVLLAKGMAGRVQEALAEYAGFKEQATSGGSASVSDSRTRSLIQRLESLSEDTRVSGSRPHRKPEPEPELCGRENELAVLNRAIAAPSDDSFPTTVVVSGEGGIGKTRLVHEAIRGAHLRGFTILKAGSSEFERDIPLNPLLEALDQEATHAAIRELEEPWHSVVLSLLPQFHREAGPLPEVPYVEPGNLPRRTYEALRRLIECLAQRSPILLFLDDFQWADETSVAAVEFLRRRWKGGRLVMVLALRPSGPTQPRRAEALTEDLTRAGLGVRIPLKELAEPAIYELIDSVVDGELAPSERRRISLLGGRNPFFTVELAHEYVEGRLELRTAPGEPIPVPVSIRQLLERRLQDLTPLAERILEALSVLGARCTVHQIAELCDEPRADCATAVDQLQAARLIHWDDGGFALRHQLVRHTVYDRLQEASTRILHERIAEWLLDRGEAPPGELALHFDRAGRAGQALEFSLQAADLAEASGAVPEAVHLLTTARRNTSDPEKAAEIVGRLGHLHHMHRNFTEAAPLLDVAAERFRQQGRVSDALAAESKKIDALSRLELLPLQDFIQKAQDLKREARARGEWETLTHLLDVEVHTLDREGKVGAVRKVLKEAEELCDKGSPEAQCAARATLAIHFLYGSPTIALKAAREAVTIAQKHRLSGILMKSCNRLMGALINQGLLHTAEGRRVIGIADELAKKAGDRHHRYFLPLNQGVWYMDIGDLARAEHCFERAQKVVDEDSAPELEAVLDVNLGELAYIARKSSQARTKFESVVHQIGSVAGIPTIETAKAGLGLCALSDGKLADAVSISEGLQEEPEAWVFDRSLIVLFRTRLFRRMGRLEDGIDLLNETTSQIRERFVLSWIKLKLEEVRLCQGNDPQRGLSEAKDGFIVAKELGLERRAKEFLRLTELLS